MSIAETLLAEFEQEIHATRKHLERLPGQNLGWRPHAKSMTAGQLALHIATVPAQVLKMALEDNASVPNAPFLQPRDTREITGAFERTIAAVRKDLSAIPDERMLSIWRMSRDGMEILAMPRAAFLRSVLLNHWYHHRAQLGVYLRLLDIPVPATYGPSGDEPPDFLR